MTTLILRQNYLVYVQVEQRIETMINEEALLLAKYIREERKEWVPRISS